MATVFHSPHAAGLMTDFSMEMTGKDIPALREANRDIPAGTKVNVTFLGSEDLETRVAAAAAVRQSGLVPVPHISARRLRSHEQLKEFLDRLREVEATDHLCVVGGDPTEPHGPYSDSLSVIRSGLLHDYGAREVSIAGYPEGHPTIPDGMLWGHLDEKTSELAHQGIDAVLLTQFSFNTEPVVRWISAVRDRGVESQIRVGTPGPAGVKRLLRFARQFGVGANAMIVKKYGFSLTNLMGTAGPDQFLCELADRLAVDEVTGPVRLHFYAFGGLQATAAWAREFVAEQASGSLR